VFQTSTPIFKQTKEIKTMKKVFFIILLATVGIFAQINDRTEYKLVFADSISNTQVKTFYVDVSNVEAFDSLGFALAQYGAVGMDSVLTYYLGTNKVITFGTTGTAGLKLNAWGSGVNIATATDITTTGTNSAYTLYSTRLSKATVIPYPVIKCTVTAITGNTASATAQRVGVYAIFYR
jgi:hypothetical protein